MRIGFDCAKLVKGTSKSIGIYNVTKSVVSLLVKHLSKEHQLVVIGNESNRCDFDLEGVEFISVKLNIDSTKSILLWETFKVNSYIKKLKLDRVVFPRGFTSLFCPVKDVIIVHDMIPFFYNRYFPGVLGRVQNAYVMMRLKGSIKSADKIITISEYSKQDIVNIVPKAKDKVSVILHGFDTHKRENLKKPDMANDYFFAITSSKLLHKNPTAVIKSYIDYCGCTDKPYDLVLSGVKNLDELNMEIPEDVLEKIHCTGFVSDEEFYSLFKYSKGLVFLSLIEGFGLPPLEAMELGVPVICSNRTSLPEVVCGAGILVNPDNYAEVADAMKLLTEEADIAGEYVRKGTANLANFQWENRIGKYIEVLTGK